MNIDYCVVIVDLINENVGNNIKKWENLKVFLLYEKLMI